jgi:hypothetical protein
MEGVLEVMVNNVNKQQAPVKSDKDLRLTLTKLVTSMR